MRDLARVLWLAQVHGACFDLLRMKDVPEELRTTITALRDAVEQELESYGVEIRHVTPDSE